MPPLRPIVVAHHLILSGYGFWLANDPRGSGSNILREPKFQGLGPLHHGRKTIQPSREELRNFYSAAVPKLEHEPIWFGPHERTHIATALEMAITRRGYTVWACSIGSNHVHLCIRRHRDPYQTMWNNLTAQTRNTLVAQGFANAAHPVWASRPYSVYLHTPEDIRRTVKYIEENPMKEGLSPQTWCFTHPYDGWPHVRKDRDEASRSENQNDV